MNDVLLLTCKELIDDAKVGCVDIVFKDTCLEILAKAKLVLPSDQFDELVVYAADRIVVKEIPNVKRRAPLRKF